VGFLSTGTDFVRVGFNIARNIQYPLGYFKYKVKLTRTSTGKLHFQGQGNDEEFF